MKFFKDEINKVTKDQAVLDHEKMRYSMIHKANSEAMQSLHDTRKRAIKVLTIQ
jgi:bisphosphoglycerate-dependent phosphoglycerate mutase